ncbi:DUF4032 domain-containing protein [Georgenia sp. 10Sc9-8]|uniref:DUF4032 domain-containing protein n=1 Tax=Georgenia halotolerans TaxID=3028317 RepID=A0ABT5U0V1_9MICO|nr:DUF4032 domain-containing protein [Georgenia halotolerans]
MPQSLQITAAQLDPALLDLPWEVALEEWPDEVLAALPRGLSRHVVRFAKLSGRVVAIKEIGESVAYREYELLRSLSRLEAPSVQPIAVITGRRSPDGEELNSVLVTQHLQFSLPYRALFSQYMRPETATRLIDALSVLLVRMHLTGFYWGDVSLSNTLFRRDAGAFAAYLVDAETAELHPSLTNGQRNYDVDLARTNIIGELMDLQAGEVLDEDVDVIAVGDRIVQRYGSLWSELTDEETLDPGERWRVTARIERLNELGYDVGEITLTTDVDGTTLRIQPKVVDAGHYHRQVMRLTGLDVQENQGRRMLNDLESYRVVHDRQGEPLEFVAHDWLAEVFEPTVRAIPRELRGKLEPAEVFHEVLEHRWFISERQRRDVPLTEAVRSYITDILRHRPDEQAYLGSDTGEIPRVSDY